MEFKIHNFDTVSSTNDVAARAEYGHGAIVTAHQQSAGRGQRGNKWESRPGENLMFTMVVEPTHIKVCEQFLISIITSLSVVDALLEYGIEARIKWPNDIYVGERKITGILIEHSFSSEFLQKSVLGVGINVRQMQFSPDVANPTSMALCGVQDITPSEVLGAFCESFSRYYGMTAPQLHEQYMKKLYRADGFFRYRDKNEEFQARIVTVDPMSGLMTLCSRDGESRDYYFKEVEYIK